MKYFKKMNAVEKLAKKVYTGITASLIGGKTLHVLFGLTIQQSGMLSTNKIQQLAQVWSRKEYLIINEYLMVSCTLLAQMSTILGLIWQHNNPTNTSSLPWGGMNIIISGDFHQFKPIVQKKRAPLYWPVNAMQDNEEEAMGSELYGQFKTVVCLTHQMHVQDEEWTDFC